MLSKNSRVLHCTGSTAQGGHWLHLNIYARFSKHKRNSSVLEQIFNVSNSGMLDLVIFWKGHSGTCLAQPDQKGVSTGPVTHVAKRVHAKCPPIVCPFGMLSFVPSMLQPTVILCFRANLPSCRPAFRRYTSRSATKS